MSAIFESVTTSVSSIEDRREFVTGEGRLVTGEERLVTGGKGFIVGRREYITVCKDRKRVRKDS